MVGSSAILNLLFRLTGLYRVPSYKAAVNWLECEKNTEHLLRLRCGGSKAAEVKIELQRHPGVWRTRVRQENKIELDFFLPVLPPSLLVDTPVV